MALAMDRPAPLTWMRQASSLTLTDLLGEARASFASELAIPLTVGQPPELYEVVDGERMYLGTEAAKIGLSMSAPMYRRIGHPDGYGNTFPVARALYDLAGWCRGRHLEARTGVWTDHAADLAIPNIERPLCARLAWHAIVWRVEPAWSARQEELSLAVVRYRLKDALEHMWDKRRWWAMGGPLSAADLVITQQRQERRAARDRVDASRADGVLCRFCRLPYDAESQEPCGGDPEQPVDDAYLAAIAAVGGALLCSPAAS